MTFAISALCERSGMLGIAVTTSSICVGSRCPWVRARVGAVSTQNVTLPALGPRILDALEAGDEAAAALSRVMRDAPYAEYRQLIVVDRNGGLASFSGAKTLGTNAVANGKACVAAGNLLSHAQVPQAMVDAFAGKPADHLAGRLIRSLQAGIDAGGELGPTHSAAVLVAGAEEWPIVDLRVDWDDRDPVAALQALWVAYEPQAEDYRLRALDPRKAPSYGVPGDE